MGKEKRDVLVPAYSAFEKIELRKCIFNKSHILPGQEKFLPLLSFGQGATGL